MRYTITTVCLISFLLGSVPAAMAEIYKYTDRRGVIHLTDRPPDSRYRPVFPGNKNSISFGSSFRSFNDHQYDHIIRMLCREHQMDFSLVKAVIKAESAFNPRAVSRKGAQGLMQLMPGTARDMGVSDPFDPVQNIYGGARYLRMLANRFDGDIVLTLSGYHAGGGAVDQVGGIPYTQTAEYVRMVLNAYYAYQKQLPASAATP